MRISKTKSHGFTLAEVVLALGVIAFGVVAILGVFPIALQTSHSGQDETRAAQIAQTIFGSLVGRAQSQFTNVQFLLSDGTTWSQPAIDLTAATCTTPAVTLYADNYGNLSQTSTSVSYAILIYTCNSSCSNSNCTSGFTDPATANLVTVRVSWPANAPAANQTFRDYVRIISKY